MIIVNKSVWLGCWLVYYLSICLTACVSYPVARNLCHSKSCKNITHLDMNQQLPPNSTVLEAQTKKITKRQLLFWHLVKLVLTQTSSSSVLPTPPLVILIPASLSQHSLPHLHLLSFFPSSLAPSLWVPTRSYHRDQRYHGNCGLQQRRAADFLSLPHTH